MAKNLCNITSFNQYCSLPKQIFEPSISTSHCENFLVCHDSWIKNYVVFMILPKFIKCFGATTIYNKCPIYLGSFTNLNRIFASHSFNKIVEINSKLPFAKILRNSIFFNKRHVLTSVHLFPIWIYIWNFVSQNSIIYKNRNRHPS